MAESIQKEQMLLARQIERSVYVVIGITLLGLAVLGGCSGQSSATVESATGAEENSLLASGQAIYDAQCAECHGPDGEGQPNWKRPGPDGVFPAPPHDSSGHTWHHSDSQLVEIISQGGSMPNSTMPAYGDSLSEGEIEAVLAYIKTFWGPREQKFQEQVTKQSATQ